MNFEPTIVSLAPSGLCKQSYNPRQYPGKDLKQQKPLTACTEQEAHESPIKKRLRARKEAARMQQTSTEENVELSKDRSTLKERAENISVEKTDNYYNENKKKVEQFVGSKKSEDNFMSLSRNFIIPDKESIASIYLYLYRIT